MSDHSPERHISSNHTGNLISFAPRSVHSDGGSHRTAHMSKLSRPFEGSFMPASGKPSSCSSKSSHRTTPRNHAIAQQNGYEYHHDFDLHAGAEPGVNPLSGRAIAAYSHFKQECVIDIIDYDCDDIQLRRFSNEGLISLMKEPGPRGYLNDAQKPLPTRMVRWISIGGIDWEVLSAIAVRYKLHSLALEDILHEQGHNHSKADYYAGHLFIRVLSHSVKVVAPEDDLDGPETSEPGSVQKDPATAMQPADVDLEEGGYVLLGKATNDNATMSRTKPETSFEFPHSFHSPLKRRFTGLSGFGGPARESRNKAIEKLKGDRVAVKHEPMFIFFLSDGTVISIHTSPSLEFSLPIKERLNLPDSILRVSEDASLLVEALLDLVVDRILEVIDEYQVKLSELEHDILLRPVMKSVRSLHILSGDLIMEKRTMDPIRSMIYNLRHHDLQHCQALSDSLAKESRFLDARNLKTAAEHEDQEAGARRERETQSIASEFDADPGDADAERPGTTVLPVRGYFSFQAKVYLADVSDHMDFALSSLDMFDDMSENLLNFAFNIASYDMNVIMNRLTITTIVFLPLTLLTGYFGMNFTAFWSINNNSDLFFWKLAIPIMAVLIPMLMFGDIKSFIRYTMRRKEARQAVRQVRRRHG
ncbi:hypothetical protein BDN70DRAFT_869982 [Pholiota conissans]|uniref:Magnesium transporter n=1 Tax=Pholiota conissans TaxID=109636 RepID=A0A9P5ZEW0_9AGAR|nr:hypothetical protein BDN70DRAFT_869982 [Pholiota conissans]